MDLLNKFDSIIAMQAALPFQKANPFTIVMDEIHSETEATIEGRRTILAGTNNYMGLTFNPEALEAAKQAIDDYGTGTTGSRVLNGTYASHKTLEKKIAQFYDMKTCMVFSTGYQANLGLISTLAGKNDFLLLDADSHASIYDGASMGNATVVRFKHNDADNLERRLKRLPADAGKLVVVEGIYSMLGDQAPLKEILEVSKAYGAMTLVDEAHSMGFCGPKGRGVSEAQGVEHLCDFIVGTFSKSVGTMGGFAVSNHPKFDVLRVTCRPYIFTASPPPSIIASAIANFATIEKSDAMRTCVWDNAKHLHKGLKDAGFKMATDTPESPIIAVHMPDIATATLLWERIILNGVYVNLSAPPATPANTFLMRVSLSAQHKADQIDKIIDAFIKSAREIDYKLTSD